MPAVTNSARRIKTLFRRILDYAKQRVFHIFYFAYYCVLLKKYTYFFERCDDFNNNDKSQMIIQLSAVAMYHKRKLL